MIAEFTAAMAAIKETASLAKVFSDAKTEAEINAAIGDMISKLTSVQRECISLVELARSYQEEAIALKAKIADFENFKHQAEGYALNQLDSGSFVYSKKQIVGNSEAIVHLCPHCFEGKKISILQPGVDKAVRAYHWVHFCPSCSAEFKMGKASSEERKPLHQRLAR
jgi:hypothetical protein